MKYTSLVIFALVFLTGSRQVIAQDEFRVNWIINDLTPYDSYMIEAFKVNGNELDLSGSEGGLEFLEAFRKNMARLGLEARDQSALHVLFEIEQDTLDRGYQSLDGTVDPEDKVFDMKFTLIDHDVKEKLVVAYYSSVTRDPKELNKEVRKIINEFFEEAELAR